MFSTTATPFYIFTVPSTLDGHLSFASLGCCEQDTDHLIPVCSCVHFSSELMSGIKFLGQSVCIDMFNANRKGQKLSSVPVPIDTTASTVRVTVVLYSCQLSVASY